MTFALPWLFGISVPLIEIPFSFHLSSLLFSPIIKIGPVLLSPKGVLPNKKLRQFSTQAFLSLHCKTHPMKSSRLDAKAMGASFCWRLGCWEAPEQRCKLCGLFFLVKSAHSLSLGLVPTPNLKLLPCAGLLRVVYRETHMTILSLSPTKTSLPSPASQVLP